MTCQGHKNASWESQDAHLGLDPLVYLPYGILTASIANSNHSHHRYYQRQGTLEAERPELRCQLHYALDLCMALGKLCKPLGLSFLLSKMG